jgi:branched-chain amino acid transport system ATP-binding protein
MLKLEDVHSYYGRSHILQGISLDVPAGEVVCLVGRNGAGKTTTLHTIMGFVIARSGKIIFEGRDLTRLRAHQISRLGLSLVPEDRRIFPKFTVLENLRVAQVYARSADRMWTEEEIFEFFPSLEQRRQHRGTELSGGEQQMLAIGRALMANPRLLLLDEPAEGLAPFLVKLVRDVILRLKDMDTTVLLVEQHNLDMVFSVGDYFYVLVKGQIIYQGDREDFVSRPEIRQKYLGV